jgi:uncharacterized membrane protein
VKPLDPQQEHRFEERLAAGLRIGVLLSGAIVLVGGTIHLARHHADHVSYELLDKGREPQLRTVGQVATAVVDLDGSAVIQLGLLVLIATPVTRVIFSAVGFARQRDFTYVALTLVVLAVLLYGLFIEEP